MKAHSLSIVLGLAFVVCIAISLAVEVDGWAGNFWIHMGAGFVGVLVFVLASKWTYERGADPTKPTLKPPVKRK